MSQPYRGKKIGKLEVKLDRKKSHYKWATVDVDLRFDISNGTFYAQYEGNWYSADTKAALAEQIKVVATKALSVEWKRYIQINYEAQGWPIEDTKSGRPECSGRYHTYGLDDDRSKFDDEDRSVRTTHEEPNKDPLKHAICGLELHWSICEISEPYPLPEDPKKNVRAKREVDTWGWGPDMGKEKIGDPQEWEDDVLPPGMLLWTPEREALLVEVIAALGRLDARLLSLFTGDAAQLAAKIDAAAQTDPSRLLAAPNNPAPAPPKKRRSA